MRILVLGMAFTFALTVSAQARGGHGGGYGGHSSSHASTPGDHVVSGYTRSNGTYVAPYHATNPNSTKNDNYSTVGNVNPYTGQTGTKPSGPN